MAIGQYPDSLYFLQDSPTEMAFKYAVYKINKDPTIFANRTLTYDIQYVPREDSFRTTNKVIFVELFFPQKLLNYFLSDM